MAGRKRVFILAILATMSAMVMFNSHKIDWDDYWRKQRDMKTAA